MSARTVATHVDWRSVDSRGLGTEIVACDHSGMTSVLDSETSSPGVARRWASRRVAVLVATVVVLVGGGIVGLLVWHFSGPSSLVRGLSDDRPDLSKGISGGSVGMGPAGVAVEMGTFLCGTRDVTITSMSLYRPSSGVRLVRWGIENEVVPGTGNASLAQLGSFTSQTITQHCGASSYSRVGIQLQRTQPGTQSFLGLRVTYQSDGRTKVAYLWEQYQLRELTVPKRGVISGQLFISPPMGHSYPTRGSIEVTGSERIVLAVGPSGKFEASVPAGRYQVVGHSPYFGDSKYDCIVGHSIAVHPQETTPVVVVCQEK